MAAVCFSSHTSCQRALGQDTGPGLPGAGSPPVQPCFRLTFCLSGS